MKQCEIKKGAIIINTEISSLEERGIERILDRSPMDVDILHNIEPKSGRLLDYVWVLILDNSNEKNAVLDNANILDMDAWEVRANGDHLVQIKIHAGTNRAMLYALYHIASCLEEGKPFKEWTIKRCPLVPHRYAWISAGNCWSSVFRPDWFDRDIVEMPGMGFNGVILTCTPTHGTSIGRQTIPFTITKEGIKVDRFKLPAFQTLFNRLKSYGLEICLFHQAFIPPAFSLEEVKAYYNGKIKLKGLEDAVENSSYELAAAIFTYLPQVDSLLHHSIECDWFWGEAASIFPCIDDVTAEGAFDAYLKGMGKACKEFGKDLLFWTHVSGVSARQIRLMHKILKRHPEVVVMEDHSWPNNCWPHSPVMGHIAKDIQDEVVKGRFGLTIDTTDGEYYGAGALPTAFPEPHIKAAIAAVEDKAEYVFVRLNEQSLTPLGTLEDMNTIHVLAASEQWWEPKRELRKLWRVWCTKRFGTAAASQVISALQKSSIIIKKGLSASGMALIDHSGLPVGNWRPNSSTNAWALFNKPGELLVDKPYDELLGSDFRAWQVGARGIELEEFLCDSNEAEVAAQKALYEIESVKENLAPDDYEYLSSCYQDALIIIEAIRQAAIAAHVSGLYLKNRSKINRETLLEACNSLELCADKIQEKRGKDFRSLQFFQKTTLSGQEYSGYGVPIALRSISEMYRKLSNS